MKRLAAIFAAMLVLLMSGGCKTVEPWERGKLSDYTMRPDRDVIKKTSQEHVCFSREAASGGGSVGGAGCGCN